MTFGQSCGPALPTKGAKKFWASWLYMTLRKDFMRDVRNETFGRNLNLSVEYQEGLIKEAVTAISFGARANVNGWRTQDGDWTNPALVNVLKNTAQRNAFLNSYTIQQFIKEQALLDTYLLSCSLNCRVYGPVITRNVAQSKAVAYMYQSLKPR
jgi:hypothetical protein